MSPNSQPFTPASSARTLPWLQTPLQAARRTLNVGKSAILDLILPPTCRLCNGQVPSAVDFCIPCTRALTLSEPMMRSACLRCGRPRPKVAGPKAAGIPTDAPVGQDSKAREPCVQCRGEKNLFRSVVPLWSYQDRVCEAIVAAKYGHQAALASSLGRRLGRKLSGMVATEMPDLITFVPSHFTRHFQRGGNGNQAIASGVCDELAGLQTGIKCRALLKMTRRVKKQAWLDNAQRRENVRDAFAVKKSYALAKTLANQHVLLVDDVVTTGATANEVTRVLLGSGAKTVTLAVVARAIRSVQ